MVRRACTSRISVTLLNVSLMIAISMFSIVIYVKKVANAKKMKHSYVEGSPEKSS